MLSHRKSLVLTVAVAAGLAAAGCGRASAAPGFYSVAELRGVWWFVDPQGEPLYSLGINDIHPGPTPSTYNPQRPAYAAFRYYKSTDDWADHTLQRFQQWKFNTIGGWADERLTRGPLPYTVVLHVGSHLGCPWQDIFSNEFESQVDQLVREKVGPRRGDPLLLGWFSDNELGWYPTAIFQYHLDQRGTATRAHLLGLLEQAYGRDFAALKDDFAVDQASSWDELVRGGVLRPRAGTGARKIVLRFTADVARRYYRVIHDAIRHYDPSHLILGDRYARHCPEVVAQAAAPYVDVISTNIDWPVADDGYLPQGYLENLHRLTGRPILVTEYYVAADDNRSGNRNTGDIFLTVATQNLRVAAFENRLRILARLPFVVGAHWFRYADEPPHGRPGDGEDYNFGLVDIEDRPYEELVDSMTRLHAAVPRLHRQPQRTNVTPKDHLAIPRSAVAGSEMLAHLATAQSLYPHDTSLRLHDLLAAWTDDQLRLMALVWDEPERANYSDPPSGEPLSLTIDSPAMERPVRIAFGRGENALCRTPGVQCWLSANRLHRTLVAALPAAIFRTPHLQAGDQYEITIRLEDSLGMDPVFCKRTLLLSPATR